MSEAIQRQQRPPITGSYHDSKAIAGRLDAAAKKYHLVAPATSAPSVPEGCDVVFSQVEIDVEHDTYRITDNQFGLSKTALQKIASAAGVSWDSTRSRRTDDGSDPHYCSWVAVGHVRHFDGTVVEIVGSKEMDLRDGSAQVEALYDRYRTGLAAYKSGRKKYEPKDPSGQIREMRLHIAQHAETKAQLRAIRSIGVRTSYEPAELRKPFIVARLMFTGRSEDPELRRLFAEKQADAMLGGVRALYGTEPARPALAASHGYARHAPPPLGASKPDPDEGWEPEDDRAIEAQGEEVKAAPAQTAKPAKGGPINTADFTVPGGKEKGTPLPEASDSTINYWRNRIATNLDEGTSKFPAQDEKLLAALEAEYDRRADQQAAGDDARRDSDESDFSLDG